MARVVAFIPDLLFGSRVQASLRGEGHEVDLIGDWDRLLRAAPGSDVLIVDLTDEPAHRVAMFESLAREQTLEAAQTLEGLRTLAFYSHVDVDTRRLAEGARFDLIVPRSRMAREGGELVTRLTALASAHPD